MLTTIGSQFYVLRTRLVQELIPYIKTYYAELCVGKEEVSIAYIPSWLKYEDPSLQELLDSQFSRDEVKEQLDTVIEAETSLANINEGFLYSALMQTRSYFLSMAKMQAILRAKASNDRSF